MGRGPAGRRPATGRPQASAGPPLGSGPAITGQAAGCDHCYSATVCLSPCSWTRLLLSCVPAGSVGGCLRSRRRPVHVDRAVRGSADPHVFGPAHLAAERQSERGQVLLPRFVFRYPQCRRDQSAFLLEKLVLR